MRRGGLRWALVALGAAPWIATLAWPVLPSWARAVIDALGAASCHRILARTLTLGDVAMPVCSRCAGFYAGLGLGAAAVWPRLSRRGALMASAVAALAMLVDVVAQDASAHALSHPLRLSTGAALGWTVALGLLAPREPDVARRG